MATFFTLPPEAAPVAPGIYIANVIKAVDRVSIASNSFIAMVLETLPDRHRILASVAFTETTRPVVVAICRSAELVMPLEKDVAVDLEAKHLLGRILYIRVETDEDGAPRVVRYMVRQQALAANPALAKVAIVPQEPLALPVVCPPVR